jgi:hypothetical protein
MPIPPPNPTSIDTSHRTDTFARYENLRYAITERYRHRLASADPAIGYSCVGFLLAKRSGNAAARAVLDRYHTISMWLYTRRRREDQRADHRDHLAQRIWRNYCLFCTRETGPRPITGPTHIRK